MADDINLFTRFARLTAAAPLQIGEVTAHNTDGTSTVLTPAGGFLRPRGQQVPVGQQAFVREGVIDGTAPALPVVTIDV